MKNFHFIGIGGVSMGALAKFLHAKGHFVSGNDINPNVCLAGIDTTENNKFENIKNADFVITTGAIGEDDEALVFAKKMGKKILSRATLLGKIAQGFKNVIAISGTHGKTTTTAMLGEVFITAHLCPTVHLGGNSNKFGGNLLIGKNNFFITEACEYTNSFLSLDPTVAVVLNVQPEHLDFFKTFKCEKQSFLQFAGQSKTVIAPKNLGIKNAITFGQDGVFTAKNISKTPLGFCFDVCKNGQKVFALNLNSFIEKNIENALAVCAVCDFFAIAPKHIQFALSNFCGVKRRCEVQSQHPLVIHDYAHHPDEIKAVIQSAKAHFGGQILVVFQPHTYSRTQAFFADFVKALCLADRVVLLPTYSAREKEIAGATSKDLFLNIVGKAPVHYFDDFSSAKKFVLKAKEKTILVLGAGDIEYFWNKK